MTGPARVQDTQPVDLGWTVKRSLRGVCGWHIYASRTRTLLGECVAEACTHERLKAIELEEGTWYCRVRAKFCNGTEESWKRCEVHTLHVRRGKRKPNRAPRDPGGGSSAPPMHAHVELDPPATKDTRAWLQVVEAPTGAPLRGRVVAEIEQRPGDHLAPHARLAHPVAMPGSPHRPSSGTVPFATRKLHVRNVTLDGGAGDWTEFDAPVMDRRDFETVVIATVNASAGTAVGFPAVPAGSTFELAAGDGYRQRKLLTMDDAAWADFGPMDSLVATPMASAYWPEVTIPTDEIDLTDDAIFAIECVDQIARKTLTDAFTTTPMNMLAGLPMAPEQDEGEIETHAHTNNSRWWSSHHRMDGSPMQPLRFCRWEVRADTVTPIVAAWRKYVPGLLLRGRYVQARMVLRDPTGWHQVVSGNVRVHALYPRRTEYGTVQVQAGAGSATVNLNVSPYTGASLFPKVAFVTATARNNSAVLVTTTGVAKGMTSFGIVVLDVLTGAAPAGAVDVDWMAAGH